MGVDSIPLSQAADVRFINMVQVKIDTLTFQIR